MGRVIRKGAAGARHFFAGAPAMVKSKSRSGHRQAWPSAEAIGATPISPVSHACTPTQGQEQIDAGIGKRPMELLGLLLRRGERLREVRIEDVETHAGELFEAGGKAPLFLDQITGSHDADVVQGGNLRAGEPLNSLNLSPIRDKYNPLGSLTAAHNPCQTRRPPFITVTWLPDRLKRRKTSSDGF
jgi:hypothetical protein